MQGKRFAVLIGVSVSKPENCTLREAHVWHALIFPGFTRTSCFVKPGKMRAGQVMISVLSMPGMQATHTDASQIYGALQSVIA
ncbi:hypothetical protein KSC_014690 [Ktedonobacter sp. SOSP1-52]|nr:hypothetical protein KSC_014690 [Ktedonobacter sp. SOSP1-52]